MGLKTPKVSVLTPTYNRPDYLKEAIESVLKQDFSAWEMLIMNDGGIDVREVVESFNDKRIRYFHRPENQGKASCLNYLLKRAAGEYIAYLDDDDIWYSNHLQLLSTVLDAEPEAGAVYSDLYAVQFVKDEKRKKRYPLHKFIQVSRDFNRDFMFCFNHTLHVSLMHRKDLAFRAGLYDERITVLIDWNMTRKLCFFTDFKYIPTLTGEYYIPIWKSDRISNLEREDQEKYKHNLRKIKADLPPEPWPKVDRIAVIFPVYRWKSEEIDTIYKLIDHLSYPVRYILVNNDLSKDEAQCRKALGIAGELRNIVIKTPHQELSELEAYRFGAKEARADYVYLVTKRFNPHLEARLISGRYYLNRFGGDGVKWEVEEERETPFDLLIAREKFLELTDPKTGKMKATVNVVPSGPPESLKFDYLIHQAKNHYEKGNYKLAYSFFKQAEEIEKGGSRPQFLIDLWAKLSFSLGKYEEAEEKSRMLIRSGYGADNWVRLGNILQRKGDFAEAIVAYREGLKEIGLKEEDLNSEIFPLTVPEDFVSFTAFLGIGECELAVGNLVEATRMLRKAAKLKANSHRVFLNFGKLFLRLNDLKRAEESLEMALKWNKNDPEAYQLMGELQEKNGEPEEAFRWYVESFKRDKTRAEVLEPLHKVGTKLGRWEEIKLLLEEFLSYRPGYIPALRILSEIYLHLGEGEKAEELLERSMVLSGGLTG